MENVATAMEAITKAVFISQALPNGSGVLLTSDLSAFT